VRRRAESGECEGGEGGEGETRATVARSSSATSLREVERRYSELHAAAVSAE
jgi:hypothetical protein